jgi:hypothetical protein
MTTSATKSILRGILRQLKVKTDKVDNTKLNTIRKYVLGQYRRQQQLHPHPTTVLTEESTSSVVGSSSSSSHMLESFAKDYLRLRVDLEERSRLHALDRGAEKQLSPHEMSRRAAARAGLQLPDLDPQLQKDFPPSPSSELTKPSPSS